MLVSSSIMKCPNCGAEVRASSKTCELCGRPVSPTARPKSVIISAPSATAPDLKVLAPKAAKLNHNDVAKKLKFDYMYGSKDAIDKAMAGFDSVFEVYRRPKVKVRELLEVAANVVYKQLKLKEVSIGLKSQKDGMFRYEVMAGMSSGIWQAHEDLAYTQGDFFSNEKYKGTSISKYSKIMLAEDSPYQMGEEDTYNRQEMLTAKRHSLDDCIEGDYIDVLIYGINDEFIGWIEVSGTWTSKIPDAQTTRFMEVLACALGAMLTTHPSLLSNQK